MLLKRGTSWSLRCSRGFLLVVRRPTERKPCKVFSSPVDSSSSRVPTTAWFKNASCLFVSWNTTSLNILHKAEFYCTEGSPQCHFKNLLSHVTVLWFIVADWWVCSSSSDGCANKEELHRKFSVFLQTTAHQVGSFYEDKSQKSHVQYLLLNFSRLKKLATISLYNKR